MAEGAEKRSRKRHALPALGAVLFQAGNERGTAIARNVSLGGILLESEHPWPPVGADIELTFSVEEHGLMFSLPGRIARVEGPRAGIAFHEESEKLQQVIEKALGAV